MNAVWINWANSVYQIIVSVTERYIGGLPEMPSRDHQELVVRVWVRTRILWKNFLGIVQLAYMYDPPL